MVPRMAPRVTRRRIAVAVVIGLHLAAAAWPAWVLLAGRSRDKVELRSALFSAYRADRSYFEAGPPDLLRSGFRVDDASLVRAARPRYERVPGVRAALEREVPAAEWARSVVHDLFATNRGNCTPGRPLTEKVEAL